MTWIYRKKKTWQLWILFCPDLIICFDCGTSNMLKFSVASALTLKRPMSCSGVPLVCPTPGVSGLEREREQQIKWLYRCIWSTFAFLHHNNNTGLLQVTNNTLWCLNFVKWGKKKRCLRLHQTPLQIVNVSSVFLINLSSIITILWLLMLVASAKNYLLTECIDIHGLLQCWPGLILL